MRSPHRNRSRSGDLDLQSMGPCCRLRSPHRNRAGSGDPALQSCGEAAVCCRCRLRSPHRNRSRSGDLDIQREAPRAARKSAGDRPPRYSILHLYRRARACPSPLLENAITVRGTGPRAPGPARLIPPLHFTKRRQRTVRCGDRPRQHPCH